MSRGTGRELQAWGCEREQEAGAPRSGDATGRESLTSTGMDSINDGIAVIATSKKIRRHAGDDWRMTPDADNGRESFMMSFPEAEL